MLNKRQVEEKCHKIRYGYYFELKTKDNLYKISYNKREKEIEYMRECRHANKRPDEDRADCYSLTQFVAYICNKIGD